MYTVCLLRANFRAARELADRLLRRAQNARDPALLLSAHYALGQALFYLGDLISSREHLEIAIPLYDPLRDLAFNIVGDGKITCLLIAALTLWALGYPEQALRSANEALALAHATTRPFNIAGTEFFFSRLLQFRREAFEAQKMAEHVMELCVDNGFSLFLAFRDSRSW